MRSMKQRIGYYWHKEEKGEIDSTTSEVSMGWASPSTLTLNSSQTLDWLGTIILTQNEKLIFHLQNYHWRIWFKSEILI